MVITSTKLCGAPIKKATIYMIAATKTSNLSIFFVDFFFERDALIYLPFFIFRKWCCIALSHFTSFLSLAHCGLCPVMEVCTWTVGHGSLRYVAVMWYHNTLFSCPIFPCVPQSWGITVLNCGRGTTVSSSSSSYSFFVWTTTIELW